jgi:parallel beta-helix repeat protein
VRPKYRFASVACGLVLVAGPVTVWAAPSFAGANPNSGFGNGGNGGPSGGGDRTLYVSNTSGADPSVAGPDSNGWSGGASAAGCVNAAYTTIGAAVAAASAGSTIVVCPGVYAEDVVVPAGKPLTLEGLGNPIVNATRQINGVQVLASGTTVEGLTVGYATGEGILVGSLPGAGGTVSRVTIRDNTVIDNDQGNPTGAVVSNSSYPECNAFEGAPGDCGEGIHLLSADGSTVIGNYVSANSGGILLTDENGPTKGDLIASNNVLANAYDCGITVAGHHAGTTTNGTTWSPVLPSAGGVFDNTISCNRSENNGVVGQGGGILLATAAPGGAVYDNLLEGNTAIGNGLAGITVHAHSPGENLNGNILRGNILGTNDLDGDPDFGGNTPPAIDPSTTGVIVATAVSPISITIVGNRISNNFYGVWMTPGVTATTTPPPNTFVGVNTPLFTAP